MFFRSLTWLNLPHGWHMTPGDLEKALAAFPLRPCEGTQFRTAGWIPPYQDGALVRSVEKQYLITLGTEQKVLPASAVKKLLKERAEAWQQQTGYKPGKKKLAELKEALVLELLPKALVRPGSVNAWLDLQHGRMAVASTSSSASFSSASFFLPGL